jgi:O-antigen/teichoic acid export membrane protein
VRGASVRALGYVLGLALSALGSILLLRYLSVSDFGAYASVAALVGIASGVSEAGFSTLGAREIAHRNSAEGRRRLVSNLLGLRLVVTVGASLAAIGVAALIGYDDTLVIGTALMCAGLLLTSAQLTIALPLTAELTMGRLAAGELLKLAVTVGGIAVLVAAGAGLVAFFGVQIVVGCVALAATTWLLAGMNTSWKPRFDRQEWGALLRLALPLALAGTIGVLYFRVLVIISSVISTPYETGLLGASYRVVELLYGLGAVAAAVALPVLSATSGNRERVAYMTQRMTEVALLSSCYLAILIAALAEPILTFLGGADYGAAAPVLQIQVFALIPAFLAQVWSYTLVATERPNGLAIASGAGLLITGGLGAVLVAVDGAQGGAIAALAGECVLALVVLMVLSFGTRSLRIHPGFVWKAALASSVLVAITIAVDSPWLVAIVGTAAFTGVAIATRAIPSELIDAFQRRRHTARG